MEKKKFFTNVIILIVIVFAAFFGYRYFFVESDEAAPELGLIAASEADPDLAQANDEFLVLLQSLDKVSLETTLFDNPAYQALTNFSRELTPEPKGRVNPFAALGVNPPFARTATTTPEDTEEDG